MEKVCVEVEQQIQLQEGIKVGEFLYKRFSDQVVELQFDTISKGKEASKNVKVRLYSEVLNKSELVVLWEHAYEKYKELEKVGA